MLFRSVSQSRYALLEVVHGHIAKQPGSVAELNSRVPRLLSDLVRKLMAKNAEDCYQSALGLKSDLGYFQSPLTGLQELPGFKLALLFPNQMISQAHNRNAKD